MPKRKNSESEQMEILHGKGKKGKLKHVHLSRADNGWSADFEHERGKQSDPDSPMDDSHRETRVYNDHKSMLSDLSDKLGDAEADE
jgi:hypothetical protein